MADLIEVCRNSVNSWECDMMGHMNMQFYVAKASDGLSVLRRHFGLGRAFVSDRDVRVRVIRHHIRFLHEQGPGAPVAIFAGVLTAGLRRLQVYEEMRNTGTREVAATFVADVQLENTRSGHVIEIPRFARRGAEKLRVDLPDYAAPRGLDATGEPSPAPVLADADANGMCATYLGDVKSTMCDECGFMTTPSYMGVISAGFPHLLAAAGQADRLRRGIGGAALEYRLAYRQTPRLGDVIALRSGIRNVSKKTYTVCHWMFDLATGQAVATAEQVAVMLDLKARKAVTIGGEIRLGLERLSVHENGAR